MKSNKPIHATHIELYFRGKEYSQIEHYETVCNGVEYKTVPRTSFGKQQFVRIDIPVPGIAKVLQYRRTLPGTHVIPFRIQLPSSLPSTVSINNYGVSTAIKYCMRAKLIGSGIFRDFQATKPVRVIGMTDLAYVETTHLGVPIATADPIYVDHSIVGLHNPPMIPGFASRFRYNESPLQRGMGQPAPHMVLRVRRASQQPCSQPLLACHLAFPLQNPHGHHFQTPQPYHRHEHERLVHCQRQERFEHCHQQEQLGHFGLSLRFGS
jgi:Arrestin (or S-antigen), N-terminal domain